MNTLLNRVITWFCLELTSCMSSILHDTLFVLLCFCFCLLFVSTDGGEAFVTWYGGEVTGPGIESSTFNLAVDYSLVFTHAITSSDEGTYTCRVSNTKGYLISNQTSIKVLG